MWPVKFKFTSLYDSYLDSYLDSHAVQPSIKHVASTQ